jgi:hypothetical protein
MALRRPDVCVECGSVLDAGVRAEWNPSLKVVTCLARVEKCGWGQVFFVPPSALGERRDRRAETRGDSQRPLAAVQRGGQMKNEDLIPDLDSDRDPDR